MKGAGLWDSAKMQIPLPGKNGVPVARLHELPVKGERALGERPTPFPPHACAEQSYNNRRIAELAPNR